METPLVPVAPVMPIAPAYLYATNDTITYRARRDASLTTARVVTVMGTTMLRVQPLRNGEPEGATCCISLDGSVTLLESAVTP